MVYPDSQGVCLIGDKVRKVVEEWTSEISFNAFCVDDVCHTVKHDVKGMAE